MPKDWREEEPDPPPAGASEDPPTRNTLVPSFDVATYARAVDGSQPKPTQVTITNETELEEARVASMKSSLPPARARVRSEAEVEIGTAEVELDGDSDTSENASDAESDPEKLLGDLSRVPALLVDVDEVPKLGLDHHAGFLLALVDGLLPYDTILDVCGMPREEAVHALARLVRRGIIGRR